MVNSYSVVQHSITVLRKTTSIFKLKAQSISVSFPNNIKCPELHTFLARAVWSDWLTFTVLVAGAADRKDSELTFGGGWAYSNFP